jgi:hypothetical protein
VRRAYLVRIHLRGNQATFAGPKANAKAYPDTNTGPARRLQRRGPQIPQRRPTMNPALRTAIYLTDDRTEIQIALFYRWNQWTVL